jgi:hypothetical protein
MVLENIVCLLSDQCSDKHEIMKVLKCKQCSILTSMQNAYTLYWHIATAEKRWFRYFNNDTIRNPKI